MNDSPQTATRQQLRRELRAARARLTATERVLAAQAVSSALKPLAAFQRARHIAGYWACSGEVPLNLVLAGMLRHEQTYWLPCLAADRQLEFARWTPGDAIAPNRYGIPEPEARATRIPPQDLDMVLVPLLGFDARGNRLGMGGGYYDATFAFLRALPRPAQPVLIGIAHPFQQVPRLASEPWDVALDFVAVGATLIDCSQARNTP